MQTRLTENLFRKALDQAFTYALDHFLKGEPLAALLPKITDEVADLLKVPLLWVGVVQPDQSICVVGSAGPKSALAPMDSVLSLDRKDEPAFMALQKKHSVSAVIKDKDKKDYTFFAQPICHQDAVLGVVCALIPGRRLSEVLVQCMDIFVQQLDQLYYMGQLRQDNLFAFVSDRIRNLDLARELPRALKNKEFFLNFQPQIDIEDKQIKGWEALVRWQHPQRGLVPPLDFIPLCERYGYIDELFNVVLDQAMEQMAVWSKMGYKDLFIAVNLSPAQFYNPVFVQHVYSTLKKYKLPAHMLELELTEGMLMHDTDKAYSLLKDLLDHGVRVALDDFGTGYSSLGYLHHFPVNKIKIDCSFVREMEQSLEMREICRAIVKLGRILNCDIVAEGVEHNSQLDIVSHIGCHIVQGYLLGRPMPAAEATEFLKQKKAK
ncbi:MAG: EAL domain-containing protein [Alphaproteobacteria bacterium]|nr:EAL domain-containing protein [Alphaproteobacteria bacterium]